jgi:hypothetical protein
MRRRRVAAPQLLDELWALCGRRRADGIVPDPAALG